MKNLNATTDTAYYLKQGNLTKFFLDTEIIKEKVFCDYDIKKNTINNYTPLNSIFNFIHHYTKFGNQEFNSKYRFERTAQEIWESKTMASCTDYTLLFVTFARQIGYPATFLHTAEDNYIKQLKNNKNCHHDGHSFCEVFYENKWILVDPTNKKIEFTYNPQKLILTYNIGPGNIYIPYFRDLDLNVKQSTKEHNEFMDKCCKNLNY